MDQPTPTPTPTPTPERRVLRRAASGRLLFGVCAGLGEYFNIDPTVVRVAFVVAGLIPPIGGTLLIAYALMTFIVPAEDAPQVAGREQVKDNLASLRSEISGLAETVRERITGEPREAAPVTDRPAAAPTPIRDDPTDAVEPKAAA
ncbi:MAG TPA: PspC domain-containing protein [Chloroflexota bacterium]|nr:PspC domain-containing protein [Chloroflexota bacterium]